MARKRAGMESGRRKIEGERTVGDAFGSGDLCWENAEEYLILTTYTLS